VLVDLAGRPHLQQAPGTHHGDAIRQRHRLDVIVRDVHRSRTEAPDELADLETDVSAKRRVQARQRLVEQEHARLADDGAPHRDALAFTTRQLGRPPIEEPLDAEHRGRLVHHARSGFTGHVAHPERKFHDFTRRHVRVERVALEDHRDVALLGRHALHRPARDRHRPGVRLFQASHQAQRRRFAAPARTDDHHDLAALDRQRDVIERGRRCLGSSLGSEALADAVEEDLGLGHGQPGADSRHHFSAQARSSRVSISM
jgi:hypothetical protein